METTTTRISMNRTRVHAMLPQTEASSGASGKYVARFSIFPFSIRNLCSLFFTWKSLDVRAISHRLSEENTHNFSCSCWRRSPTLFLPLSCSFCMCVLLWLIYFWLKCLATFSNSRATFTEWAAPNRIKVA